MVLEIKTLLRWILRIWGGEAAVKLKVWIYTPLKSRQRIGVHSRAKLIP